ncbi:MAG: protein translocase subunit SecD, partial [Planctomycetota bacterium JB042]
MAHNQTLVPNLGTRFLIILAVIVVAAIGLVERRTKFTMTDGTVMTGKVVEEESTDTTVAVERPSGTILRLAREEIASEEWFHLELDLNLGLDLKGGTSLRYKIELPEDATDEQRQDVLDQTVKTYNARLDNLGVKELSIRKAGTNEIHIELPGVSMEESESYEQVVQSLGALEFRIVADNVPGVLDLPSERAKVEAHLKSLADAGEEWTPKGIDLTRFDVTGRGGITYRWVPYSEKTILEEGRQAFPFVMLELNPTERFTGEDLERTFVTVDQGGRPALGFNMKVSRAGDFGDFTEKYKGRQMAIVLDGEVDTAPSLNERIEQQGQIHGGGAGFTSEEVKALRTVLTSGSLQVKPEKLSKATIGPTLGEASVSRGVIAGSLAGALVVVFMLVYYLGVGIISCLTLLIGMFLLIGGLGFLSATVTLPGIAGILLTVGMAVDQNILINERIREERGKGKTIGQSIKNGFERAFVTIVDAQATTFIAGFILYEFGSGPIRGFAVTLMLGIVTTMFAALYGSKALFALGLERGSFTELKMNRLLGETSILFTKYLRPCFSISAVTIVAGLAVFAIDYKDLQGLDFAGGFQARLQFEEPQEGEEIRESLAARYDNVQVVSLLSTAEDGGPTDFRITIRSSDDEAAPGDSEKVDRYLEDIRELFGDRLIADAVDVKEIAAEAGGGKTNASFAVNLTSPLDRTFVERRLAKNLAVTSVTAEEGADRAARFDVVASSPQSLNEDRLRAIVATSLADLPQGARLSDPIPESQFIGGKVGKELTNSAIKAIVVAIFFILIYIRIRFFDFIWGVAACLAIVHDVLFGLGAVAVVHYLHIVNIELDLTMIGAFLTIVGYSLNDTIVIFDRIRENLPRMKATLPEIVNVSINQTLSRTVLTSLTTLLAVAVLFLFNYGQRNVLEGFAFVILVGVLVGTYSTIFIASPALVWLTMRKERKTGKPVKFA